MLTQKELHGHWTEIKARIQEKWGELTDDELLQAKGSVNQLVGAIQQQTGTARAKVEHYLNSILNEEDTFAGQVAQTAQHASDVVQEHYETASDTVREGYEMAQDQVRSRPAESIAVTFGAGLIAGTIVGLMLRPRS